ncbi:phage portal protein [Verminephrobacter aporrectodeae subsp. tuberculatae]|uniref:phage portal protein n=1 Tax=Verminephrobacter aporrectodeae TaxID=1110389 RepID=UPI0022436DEC|nr:phage portal protein [Verminephrobacter aporrectodeae]MCW8207619.1 phage portal protein [Verminephrobacter aporrectodeae subsp. tuberculatae]
MDQNAVDLVTNAPGKPTHMDAFTFGDPVPVLDRRELLDYMECWSNGRWYEPPISWDGLAKSFRASTHHSSAIYFKRNMLASLFRPHPLLSLDTFSRWALDFLTFGNAYLERQNSRLGSALGLRHSLAKYTRRGVDPGAYFFLKPGGEYEFGAGRVFHLQEADVNQELYGLPEYLSALQAAWLNESATLFRRRYFNNGSHAGFILYISDPAQQQEDIDAIREALKASKGPGNFRNLFFYSPSGKKDGIQLIPVSEVAAKDEFFNIKNVSRDDILSAHRIPPQLLGVVPSNSGGFGSITQAAQVFFQNEIEPLQARFLALNGWMDGQEVVAFDQYEVAGDAAQKKMG